MNELGCEAKKMAEAPLFESIRETVTTIQKSLEGIRMDLEAYHAALIGEYQADPEPEADIQKVPYGGHLSWLQNALTGIANTAADIHSIECSLNKGSK